MRKVKFDHRKSFLLAEKIKQIFRDGFVLSSNIMHYIDSTFSNPSINELEEIINDEHNCERDPLVELLFFPDESVQIKLEELLEKKDFKKNDEEKVLSHMLDKKLATTIRFPENEGSFKFVVPKSSMMQFISRLNISRKLNKRLLKAIDKFVSGNCRTPVKVRLRNARVELTENEIMFLRSFFEKLKVEENYFFKCLDFMLDFFAELKDAELKDAGLKDAELKDAELKDAELKDAGLKDAGLKDDGLKDDGLKDNRNILQSLEDRKGFYFQNLQKAARFEELLNKNNMETLISRGVRIPHISKEDAMHNIVIIDTITLAVYGKQYPSPPAR